MVAALSGSDENALLPIGALLTAVGMIVVAVRSEPWGVPASVMGAYPFLVMLPYVATHGGEPSAVAIAGWGVPAVLLGYAALRRSAIHPTTRGTATVDRRMRTMSRPSSTALVAPPPGRRVETTDACG